MSIIDDALRKVQKSMENNNNEKQLNSSPQPPSPQPTQPGATQQPTPEPIKKTMYTGPKKQDKAEKAKLVNKTGKKPSKTPQLLLALTVVFVIFIIYYAQKDPNLLNKVKNFRMPAMPAKKAAPVAPKVYQPGVIAVQGTMLTDGQWVALINGKIYESGEVIEGKEIIDISLGGIEVTESGGTRFISVQGK